MIALSNAAGTVKFIEQAQRLAKAPVDEVVMGSYTLAARDGNPGRTFHRGSGYALNALGMPNPGIDYIRIHKTALSMLDKPVVISIAGHDVEEYRELSEHCTWAHAIEINLGCPNIWSDLDGQQERIGTFDPEYVFKVIDGVRQVVFETESKCEVRAKLSPIPDPYLLVEVADAADKADAVVASNTFPNAWMPNTLDTPYGGLSGEAMKPIVLGQVRQFVENGHRVIAAGGLRHGWQIADYEAAGAEGVQVGSLYYANETPDVFVSLLMDVEADRA